LPELPRELLRDHARGDVGDAARAVRQQDLDRLSGVALRERTRGSQRQHAEDRAEEFSYHGTFLLSRMLREALHPVMRFSLRRSQGRETRVDSLDQLDQLAARRLQLRAGGGRLEAPPALLEEDQAEAIGELPDLRGDGRLREVQLLGCARRALQAR